MQEKNMDLRQAVASVNGGKATKLPQEVEEGNTEYKLKLSLETARSPESFAAAGGNTLVI